MNALAGDGAACILGDGNKSTFLKLPGSGRKHPTRKEEPG
jgi:hypothetical protein